MASEGSITRLVRKLGTDDESLAQHELFGRYFEQLVFLARKRLGSSPRGAEDEEDVALSAMNSFFQRAKAEQFPDLGDRTELWALLATITVRKAINQFKRQTAAKRGCDTTAANGKRSKISYTRIQLDEVVAKEPTPEFIAALSEECRRRLAQLNNETLRKVVVRKLEGFSNAEIAKELNVAERTIGRKLHRVRQEWTEEY